MTVLIITIIILFLFIIIASSSDNSTAVTSKNVDSTSRKNSNKDQQSAPKAVSESIRSTEPSSTSHRSTPRSSSIPRTARRSNSSPTPTETQPPTTRIAASQIALKADWESYRRMVARKNIQALYHFTDRRNLPSIRQYGGLYSWSYCEEHHIEIPVRSSNDLSRELDVRRLLQDFVRLSFNPNQPMMYVAQKRGVDPFVLEISPEVIYWLHTKFSDINATSNNARVGPSLQDFININFPLALRGTWTTEEEKAAIQAEVLVKTMIPIQFIRNI